jgi:hypothetical protein
MSLWSHVIGSCHGISHAKQFVDCTRQPVQWAMNEEAASVKALPLFKIRIAIWEATLLRRRGRKAKRWKEHERKEMKRGQKIIVTNRHGCLGHYQSEFLWRCTIGCYRAQKMYCCRSSWWCGGHKQFFGRGVLVRSGLSSRSCRSDDSAYCSCFDVCSDIDPIRSAVKCFCFPRAHIF